MSSVEFDSIRSDDDAVDAQRLVLQDLMLGEFKKPIQLANPDSPQHVHNQVHRFHDDPDSFQGAYVNGKLEGLLRTIPWKVGDQAPYSTWAERRGMKPLKGEPDPFHKLGISALVASDYLDVEVQDEIMGGLLYLATERAFNLEKRSIVVPIHEFDPLRPIALEQGFKGTGRFGKAALMPELAHMVGIKRLNPKQELFEKPLD